jgi:cell division protease FtsH
VLQGFDGRARIRYDQLKRFIREDRVASVELGPDEIRGEFAAGRAPAPEGAKGDGEGSDERPTSFVTGRVEDDSLVPLLEEKEVDIVGVSESPWSSLPWLLYLMLSIGLLFVLWGGMLRRMGQGAGGLVSSFGKSKGKIFQERDVTVTFDDVAGVDEAKQELLEVIEFLKTPDKFRRLGAKIPKGLLLVGPPGTGKTLLARAVAGEAKVPFISISGSEFVEMFVGVGAARVRDLFEQAAKSAPCIVFIDELDALGRSRGGAAMGAGSNEEREQTLNQLLVEMDGFEAHHAVLIMAATNRPEVLDPALLRPGRFDRQVLVDRPDRRGRLHILRVHAREVRLGEEVDLSEVAARTPGFAGADLANLVNEAALLAARRNKTAVGMTEFSDALDRVVAGLEKKRVIGDDERRRVAYHEVGHALAGALAGSDDEIHKISIVPRGMAALGYTMTLPTEERYLMTEAAIRGKLVGLLGGRAAEEVVFGEPSTGAQNDLQKATDIARAMVMEYGMSDVVGPVTVRTEPRSAFLRGNDAGLGLSRGADVGSRLADAIDGEVRRIVEAARGEAVALLEAHRSHLEAIAERLLDAEQLEGEELRALIAAVRRDHRGRGGERPSQGDGSQGSGGSSSAPAPSPSSAAAALDGPPSSSSRPPTSRVTS